MDFLFWLFNTSDFLPRWLCGGFNQFVGTGWTYIAANLGIFGAYTTIPILLLYFINKKKEMVFPRIFWLFASFIFLCGISHLLDAMLFWTPFYRFMTLELMATAVVSWLTVAALIPIVPMALSLRSPAELQKEIDERIRAEEQLRELNENLEKIVEERTREVQEKAWQLEAANKELEAFSCSVSHDLKAPLRKIEQFNQLIQGKYGDEVDGELKDYLGRISGNAHQMSDLIEDLLKFSRSASLELTRADVDLSEVARETFHTLKSEDPHRHVETRVQDGVIAYGDKALLTTVMENLIGNAWKYTSKKEKSEIEFGAQVQDGQTVYYVKDNGVGFNMSEAHRLFRLFMRLHSKTEYPGTGIGLASVQRVVARHGGRVWAEAEPDRGATFYFTLSV